MRRLSWHDQKGSTSLTLIWFMFVTLLMAMGLDGLFGVYVTLQQARTAADAAILATTRALVMRLPDAVEEEAAKRVQSLLSDQVAQEEIDEALDALNKSQDACMQAGPELCTPLTPEEMQEATEGIKARAYRGAFPRLYRGSLSTDMSLHIAKGTWQQVVPVIRRDHLIPDDTDLGCLVQRVAEEKRSDILQEAESLAQANGASLTWNRSALALPNGLQRVVVSRTARPFGADWIFPDGNYPQLYAQNTAVLTKVGQRTPKYLPSC